MPSERKVIFGSSIIDDVNGVDGAAVTLESTWLPLLNSKTIMNE